MFAHVCVCASVRVGTCVYLCMCRDTAPPPAPHQRGGDYPGYREELKIDGTQCDERHLVQQSQLPDNQSPCNSREEAAGTVSEGRSPEHGGRGGEMELLVLPGGTEVAPRGGLLLFQEGPAREG